MKPKMHWCTAKVNLAGQGFTVFVFNEFLPVSWPEVQVLMALHGDENLMEIKPCKVSETTTRAEKNRLYAKYGNIVERVFPGHAPRMELLMPGESDDQPLIESDEGRITTPIAPAPANGHPPQPGPEPDDDDDDEGEAAKGLEPPSGPAIFKPGGIPRPRASS
jgi:hypothetical protein